MWCHFAIPAYMLSYPFQAINLMRLITSLMRCDSHLHDIQGREALFGMNLSEGAGIVGMTTVLGVVVPVDEQKVLNIQVRSQNLL